MRWASVRGMNRRLGWRAQAPPSRRRWRARLPPPPKPQPDLPVSRQSRRKWVTPTETGVMRGVESRSGAKTCAGHAAEREEKSWSRRPRKRTSICPHWGRDDDHGEHEDIQDHNRPHDAAGDPGPLSSAPDKGGRVRSRSRAHLARPRARISGCKPQQSAGMGRHSRWWQHPPISPGSRGRDQRPRQRAGWASYTPCPLDRAAADALPSHALAKRAPHQS